MRHGINKAHCTGRVPRVKSAGGNLVSGGGAAGFLHDGVRIFIVQAGWLSPGRVAGPVQGVCERAAVAPEPSRSPRRNTRCAFALRGMSAAGGASCILNWTAGGSPAIRGCRVQRGEILHARTGRRRTWSGCGNRSCRRDAQSDQGLPGFLGSAEGAGLERIGPGCASGRDLWPVGSQRFRQDDHDQIDPWSALPDRWRGVGLWPCGDRRGQERAARLFAGGIVSVQIPQRRRDTRLLRTSVQHAVVRAASARGGVDQHGRAGSGQTPSAQGILQGHDAPHRLGASPDQRSRSDRAGRTDDRAGSDRHAADEGPDPGAEGGGQDGRDVQSLVGGRAGRLRPHRDSLSGRPQGVGPRRRVAQSARRDADPGARVDRRGQAGDPPGDRAQRRQPGGHGKPDDHARGTVPGHREGERSSSRAAGGSPDRRGGGRHGIAWRANSGSAIPRGVATRERSWFWNKRYSRFWCGCGKTWDRLPGCCWP